MAKGFAFVTSSQIIAFNPLNSEFEISTHILCFIFKEQGNICLWLSVDVLKHAQFLLFEKSISYNARPLSPGNK